MRKSMLTIIRNLILISLFFVLAVPISVLAESDDGVADCADDYTYIENESDVYITGLVSDINSKLIIPAEINGKPVVKINQDAFSGHGEITEAIVPDSVKIINSGVFKGTSITDITLPFVGYREDFDSANKEFSLFGTIFGYETTNKAGTIKQSFVYSNGNIQSWYYYIPITLKNVTITNATKIPESAFYNCTFIERIELNEGITEIGRNAFCDCTNLTDMVIPQSVNDLGELAFSGCTNLDIVILPSALKSINNSTFINCTSLNYVSFPDELEIIDTKAFESCSSLTDIVFPDGLTRINDSAFSGCSSITKLTVPDTVKRIGDGAFKGTELTEITLPFVGCTDGDASSDYQWYVFGFIFGFETKAYSYPSKALQNTEEAIGQYCYDRGSSYESASYRYVGYKYYIPRTLRKVNITNATQIPLNAFYNCTFINEITINEGVKIISESALYNCTNLEKISLPDSLNSISENVFEYCTNETIYANKNTVGYSYAKNNSINVISTKSVTLSDKNITLHRNESKSLDITVYMLNNKKDTSPSVSYTSSNDNVVTFANGKVVAKGPGKATITAACEGYKDQCEVTVYYLLETISIKNESNNIDINNSRKLSVDYSPSNTTDNKDISWSSSNNNIVSVTSDGTIRGVSKGIATITADSVMGPSDSIEIEVLVPITKIDIAESSVSMEKGESKKLTLSVSPDNTTDTYSWSSSDSNIIKVDQEGNIIAVDAGEATITVETSRGLSDSCLVKSNISSTKVELDKTSVNVFIDDKVVLYPAMTPENSTDTITWTSSDNNVVKIGTNNEIQLVAAGKARITATTTSGKTAYCDITVNNDIRVAKLVLSKEEYNYTGSAIIPDYSLEYNGEKLQTTEYYEECTNNIDVGNATIKVYGKGRYSGILEGTFSIIENAITEENVMVDLSNEPYTGRAITKTVKVTYSGKTLAEDKDYTVIYDNNISIGTANITIKGIGIYSGEVLLSFNIVELKPTEEPTIIPTQNPTSVPSQEPTEKPIATPTVEPTPFHESSGGFTENSASIKVDESVTIYANSNIVISEWKVSDSKIIYIDSHTTKKATVKAKSGGDAIVWGTTSDGIAYKYSVHVSVPQFKISRNSIKLGISGCTGMYLKFYHDEEEISDYKIKYNVTATIKNDDIVKISSYGYIEAVGIGETDITFTDRYNQVQKCHVVVEKEYDFIELETTNITFTDSDNKDYYEYPFVFGTEEPKLSVSDSAVISAYLVTYYGEKEGTLKIKPLKVGQATITLTSKWNAVATINVTVKSNFDVKDKNITLKEGEIYSGIHIPSYNYVSIESLNESVVKIKSSDETKYNYSLCAEGPGKATVTIVDKLKKKIVINVTVLPKDEFEIDSDNATYTTEIGGKIYIYSINDSCKIKKGKFKKSKIASGHIAEDGYCYIVKGKKVGSTKLTLYDEFDRTCTVVIHVTKKKVKLNYKTKTLTEGEKFTLKLKNNKKKVKWSSSDKTVATVSSKGKVVAKKKGKCTIKCKVKNGKTYKCKITVKENSYTDVKSINKYDPNDFSKAQVNFVLHKMYYNGNDLVVEVFAYNSYRYYAIKFNWIKLSFDGIPVKKKFIDVPIDLKSGDSKKMTFVFPDQKKKYNLRKIKPELYYKYWYETTY